MFAAPPLTVLMPAYNVAAYAAEAVESILAQTVSDFEFLIIDDGSTDGTTDLLRRYAAADARIRLMSRPNRGLIATLNEGLAAARAPIIARMDADDVALAQRLEKQLRFLTANPGHVLVGSDVIYTDEHGAGITRLNVCGYADAELRAGFYRKNPFFHPSVVFRKEAALKAGGYPAGALLFEDWLLWKRMMESGEAAVMPEVLVRMRLNPGSVTIDETWRPPAFRQIRLRSLQRGYVTEEDAAHLQAIVTAQSSVALKEAAHHVLLGKKFLWDNPQPQLARRHFAEAIRRYPRRLSSYALWAAAVLPAGWMQRVYRAVKGRPSSL